MAGRQWRFGVCSQSPRIEISRDGEACAGIAGVRDLDAPDGVVEQTVAAPLPGKAAGFFEPRAALKENHHAGAAAVIYDCSASARSTLSSPEP